MNRGQRWINTRVELQWNSSTQQYDEVSVEGYWYDGPMALAHNDPAYDQDSFAFYNDGTESGSTIIGSVNTNPALELDTTYLVRFLVQETAGGTGNNTSIQFEYNLNGAGWNNVTGTSSVIRATDSANLTDGGNTTQRIGAGTYLTTNGGIDDVDGLAGGANLDFAGNDEAEMLYAFQIRSADVSAGDTIQLRCTENSGTLVTTYTNTPTVTAVAPTNVSLTADSMTITDGSFQINNPTEATLVADSMSITNATMDAGLRFNVTLTPTAMTLTDGSHVVRIDRARDLIQDSLAISNGTMSVNDEVTATIEGDSLSLSDSVMDAGLHFNISLQAETLTLTDSVMSLNLETDIVLSPTVMSITDGSMPVKSNKLIVLSGDTLSLSSGTMSVNDEVIATMVAEAITITDAVMSLNLEEDIIFTADTLAISDGTLSVNDEVTATPITDSLTVSDGTLTIRRNKSVNLAADAMYIDDTSKWLRIQVGVDTNVTLESASLTITDNAVTIYRSIAGVPFMYVGDDGLVYGTGRWGDLYRIDEGSGRDFYVVNTQADYIINMYPATMTLLPKSLNVNNATGVSFTSDPLSISNGTLDARWHANVTPNGANALSISDGSLTVVYDTGEEIFLSADSMAISSGNLSVNDEVIATLSGDSMTISEGTLSVNDEVSTTPILEALSITDGVMSVSANLSVTLSAGSLSISDGSLGVNAEKTVSILSEALSVSDGTMSVNDEVNATISGDSLSISDGAMSLSFGEDVAVGLSADTLSITDAQMTLNLPKDVDLVADSYTINDGALDVLQISRIVSMQSDALSITDFSLNVRRIRDIILQGEQIEFAYGITMDVQANVDLFVSPSGEAFSITDGQLLVGVSTNVDMSADSMVMDTNHSVVIFQSEIVNLLGDVLSVTDGNVTVNASKSIDIIEANALSITDATMDAGVRIDVSPISDSMGIITHIQDIQIGPDPNLLIATIAPTKSKTLFSQTGEVWHTIKET